jgi:hypothetical protein
MSVIAIIRSGGGTHSGIVVDRLSEEAAVFSHIILFLIYEHSGCNIYEIVVG